jgi:hypothetical protein
MNSINKRISLKIIFLLLVSIIFASCTVNKNNTVINFKEIQINNEDCYSFSKNYDSINIGDNLLENNEKISFINNTSYPIFVRLKLTFSDKNNSQNIFLDSLNSFSEKDWNLIINYEDYTWQKINGYYYLINEPQNTMEIGIEKEIIFTDNLIVPNNFEEKYNGQFILTCELQTLKSNSVLSQNIKEVEKIFEEHYNYDSYATSSDYFTIDENGTLKGKEEKLSIINDNIIIPTKINNVEVKSIGVNAFFGSNNLKSVKLPSTLTKLYDFAFNGCPNLKYINIPTSINFIGYKAFNNTQFYNDLEDGPIYFNNFLYDYKGVMPNDYILNVLDGTTTICDEAFCDDTSLIGINLPSSIKNIGEMCFCNSGLKEINLPSTISKISSMMFERCFNLKSIIIPSSVDEIEGSAFYSCTNLSNVVVPTSVKKIGLFAFWNCNSLKNITLPSLDIKVGGCAFNYSSLNLTYNNRLLVDNGILRIDTTIKEIADIFSNTIFAHSKEVHINSFVSTDDLQNLEEVKYLYLDNVNDLKVLNFSNNYNGLKSFAGNMYLSSGNMFIYDTTNLSFILKE